ncbi:MAG: hypothetical protein R3250_16015, partial [Melioribacteraceae bacterium]|nr:hypothetical protein [Melioribacteraceae bacterium]
MKAIFSHTIIRYGYIAVTLLLTIVCVFTPEWELFKRIADYTVHIMLGFLFMGMFFLIIYQKKMMYTSLGACMILC